MHFGDIFQISKTTVFAFADNLVQESFLCGIIFLLVNSVNETVRKYRNHNSFYSLQVFVKANMG